MFFYILNRGAEHLFCFVVTIPGRNTHTHTNTLMHTHANVLPQELLATILQSCAFSLSFFLIWHSAMSHSDLVLFCTPTKWWRTKSQKQSHNWIRKDLETSLSCAWAIGNRSVFTYGTILFLAIVASISVNGPVNHLVAQNKPWESLLIALFLSHPTSKSNNLSSPELSPSHYNHLSVPSQ